MLQDQLALPIVGRPPTGKSRKEIVRESQARRRASYGGVSISLQVDKELHRSLKKAAEKDNITLSDYITELFLKDVEFKSSIVKNPKKEPDKKSNKRQRSKKTTNKLRLFEGFAGYGGASFGLRKAQIDHEIVGFSENDDDAVEMYKLNFPDVKNFGDIKAINEKELPDFNLFTGGFPCQPFSTVGKRLGELDTRGTLFADIIRICEYKKPEYILLENVKGLALGKQKPTFEKILSELVRIGYDPKWKILNSKDYGVPQNRERLWIFASSRKLSHGFDMEPPKVELKYRLKDFLDKDIDPELYRSKAQIDRIKFLHNIDQFEVDEPLCYDYYNRKLREDGTCMTITPPEHNVIRIVEPMLNGNERVRKLSLDEHFRIMGFDINETKREIKFPEKQTYTKIGRRAGNGWDVNLVGVLFNHIFSQL